MKKLKTPLRYPGGKSRATKFLFLHENLPETIRSYREPFLGGGSVAIEFTKRFPKKPVWVNDKYYNLFVFWKELQNNSKAMYDELLKLKTKADSYEDKIASHKELFLGCREEIANTDDLHRISICFFVINKCSFSGLTESSGFSKSASQSNFGYPNIERLPQYSELIQNWLITNLDYSELLDDCSSDEFVFADPPYDIKSFLYGKKGRHHSDFDHYLFYEHAQDCMGNVMITYNSNEVLRELYQDWFQTQWDLTYTMHSGKNYREDEGNRKELLLTNYRTL